MSEASLRPLPLILLLTTLLLMFFVLNLFLGSVVIPPKEIWTVLLQHSDSGSAYSQIVHQYRIPQAVTAMLSGAGLAVAGLYMQTLFRNPLADPSVLGISSGASLGVALLLLFSGSAAGSLMAAANLAGQTSLMLAAFAGAVLILLFITWLSRALPDMVSLLIAGMMIAYVTSALVGIAKYFSQKEDLQAFVLWGMGSFSNVGLSRLPFFSTMVLLGILASFFLVKPLNLMLIGERYAANLGVNVKKVRFYSLLVTGFLTAIITAYAGPVAFIGLAVPHLARIVFRTGSHLILLPGCILIGASLALACNLLARLPGLDGNLPVNAITSLIGAPMVIWFILKHKHLFHRNV